MGNAEGVVHHEIAQEGESAGEARVSRLLPSPSAEVLQKEDAAPDRGEAALGLPREGVGHERDGPAEERPQAPRRRSQRSAGVGVMGDHDDRIPSSEEVADGGDGRADAEVVRHPSAGDRHVEINPNEHALPADIGLAEPAEHSRWMKTAATFRVYSRDRENSDDERGVVGETR